MQERIIITLTTWSKRIGNVPIVLDSIFNQTLPPDLVVLNIALDEVVPQDVQIYLHSHNIKVNRVADTKAYKKIIPTLKQYPNDCIINIDDDWIYPKGMIEDFMNIHNRFPDFPISGNRVVIEGMQCHCGCASLLKADYFGDSLDMIDEDVMKNCSSSDIVYTYFANKANHPYIRTIGEYFLNMESFNDNDGYTDSTIGRGGIYKSYKYLVSRYGNIEKNFRPYIKDQYLADMIYDIHQRDVKYVSRIVTKQVRHEMEQTESYKLGHFFIDPISKLKNKLSKK